MKPQASSGCPVVNPATDAMQSLSVLRTPRKGGSIGHFLVVWLRSGPCLAAVDRSRCQGGAPAAYARTNDLEADEDPPHAWAARDEAKTLWFKSSAASREPCGDVCDTRAGVQPYLGPRTRVRRHDD